MADCWAKFSTGAICRCAILRESAAGWKLNYNGLLGQASQTDHGQSGHLAGVGAGLDTRLRWTVGPSFPNGPWTAWPS